MASIWKTEMVWDVHAKECWAQALGMAHTTMFGAHRSPTVAGDHTVFIDGHSASFCLSMSAGDELVFDPSPISWSWSAYLRHALILTGSSTQLFLRTWDAPANAERIRVPRSSQEAELLLTSLASITPPRTSDVVGCMMSVFKRLRASMSTYDANSVHVFKAFNLLLKTAENTGIDSLNEIETLRQVMEVSGQQVDDSLSGYANAYIGDAIEIMSSSAPIGKLDTGLLVRHASGRLYQEAHFELERQAFIQQTIFGYNEPNQTTKGVRPRDARFTPPALARSLINQCLGHVDCKTSVLEILDPACGSGVFLQECLRELDSRVFAGTVRLRGFDTSPVSNVIAKFCINHSISDLGRPDLNATSEITEENALSADWGNPNVVLMNPPFSSYKDMSPEDRESCRHVLGDVAKGHFDKAMAFIWKAINSVRPGGVVASILPSSLLESDHGKNWRAAITEKAQLKAVGRFRGYSYFQDAMVEPAFIVLRKNQDLATKDDDVIILEAEENSEDAAMRTLRKGVECSTEDIFLATNCPQPSHGAAWMPRGIRNQGLLAAVTNTTSTVGSLFEVRQGVLTGNNNVFVLSKEEWSNLATPEQQFFRPAAGTSTIANGQLLSKEFVFYPHGAEAADKLRTEEDVRQNLPVYYERWLAPAKQQLIQRRGKTLSNWWTMTEYRAWQLQKIPKIVTAYFGLAGKFAFDPEGQFVCVHGYAWIRREHLDAADASPADMDGANDMYEGDRIAWAYLAILNCPLFNKLLESFCPRVQGGQFNLSKRFVSRVPLPDLTTGQVTRELLEELSSYGESISRGEAVEYDRLASVVTRSYGVSLARWK